MSREKLVQYFFFAVFLLLLWQVLRLLSPFYVAILGSAILSLMVYPMHAFLLRRMGRFPNVAAVLSTALTVIIIVVPFLLFGWVFLKETGKISPVVQAWVSDMQDLRSGAQALPAPLAGAWEKTAALLGFWNIDPSEFLIDNMDELGRRMTGLATAVIRNIFFVIFNVLVLVFTLFFFLRDGPHIIHRLVELIPMDDDHKQAILERIQTTLFAVIRGVLAVAAVQGTLAGVGFALFGVPFPILLGVLTTVLAPIPFVGTAGVWIPVVLSLLANGSSQQALYVTLWSALVVGMIDNLLRPLLISSDTKIPILLLFFGMLGGLRVYGFSGLLIGPILIALVLAFIKIYKQEYHWLLSLPSPKSKGD